MWPAYYSRFRYKLIFLVDEIGGHKLSHGFVETFYIVDEFILGNSDNFNDEQNQLLSVPVPEPVEGEPVEGEPVEGEPAEGPSVVVLADTTDSGRKSENL